MLLCLIGYLAGDVFQSVWSIVCGLKLFDPSGKGWIYSAVGLLMDVSSVTMLAFIVREVKSSPFPKSPISSNPELEKAYLPSSVS